MLQSNFSYAKNNIKLTLTVIYKVWNTGVVYVSIWAPSPQLKKILNLKHFSPSISSEGHLLEVSGNCGSVNIPNKPHWAFYLEWTFIPWAWVRLIEFKKPFQGLAGPFSLHCKHCLSWQSTFRDSGSFTVPVSEVSWKEHPAASVLQPPKCTIIPQ